MRLADVIGRWIGQVEIVLAGADNDLREGKDALAAGDAMRARAAAHRVLELAPESPLALALLADACEAGHLEAELAMTLEELARRAPSRAEVWVRLARARWATEMPLEEVRDAFARGLSVADSGSEARREALLGLADLDLCHGEGARAELWLERAAGDRSSEVIVRRAEARLLRGDASGAVKLLEPVIASPSDGRDALVRGRALASLGDIAAFPILVRAMVLDQPGASEALSSALALLPSDAQTRTRIRSVVDAKGEQELARWRAAFARAEGARESARRALRDAVVAGDRAAAQSLLDAAIEDCDADALATALGSLGDDSTDPRLPEARGLCEALRLDDVRAALDALVAIAHPRLAVWTQTAAAFLARRWVPSSGPASWGDLLGRLDAHAHAAADESIAARVGELAAERSRPVRLAVVGEFNAGKSTFINALIGADVAPTGVLPTTATLHHLRWSPDPFAKILFAPGHDPPERIVPLGELRSTLFALKEAPVARVEIRMPLATLVRVEVLDTPGFNSLEDRHTIVARTAFEEADIALWLLDATQTMKQSERTVLEEAERVRLPVQMLVNKADRLGTSDMTKVMESLAVTLGETNVASWAQPLAFSAKKALAGKLGDEPLLEASGWRAVEHLIDEQIVGRSEELKERGLRRRAAAVVAALADAWRERARADAAAAAAAAGRAAAAARAAARIERDADELSGRLAQSLVPQAQAWARDVDLVFVGRDKEAAARDPVLARYRVDRALAIVAPAFARALSSVAPEVGLSPASLVAISRAMVRASAWNTQSERETIVGELARAGVDALAEHLFALSAEAPPVGHAAGVLRELEAFASALRDR